MVHSRTQTQSQSSAAAVPASHSLQMAGSLLCGVSDAVGCSRVTDQAIAATQTNMFQIQLVTHLQSDSVPSAVVESVRDLNAAIEAATLEDLYTFYDCLKLSDADVFTCIGTSGPEVGSPTTLILFHLSFEHDKLRQSQHVCCPIRLTTACRQAPCTTPMYRNCAAVRPPCNGVQAPELPSMSQTGLPAMVTNYERTYTSYGQEATEAANAGARVSQQAA